MGFKVWQVYKEAKTRSAGRVRANNDDLPRLWSGYCHQKFTTLACSQSVQEESCLGGNIMHHATLQASESHCKA